MLSVTIAECCENAKKCPEKWVMAMWVVSLPVRVRHCALSGPRIPSFNAVIMSISNVTDAIKICLHKGRNVMTKQFQHQQQTSATVFAIRVVLFSQIAAMIIQLHVKGKGFDLFHFRWLRYHCPARNRQSNSNVDSDKFNHLNRKSS